METITSRRNALIARFRAAARGREANVLLLDGPHLVESALGAGVRVTAALVAADRANRPDMARLVAALHAAGVHLVAATAPVMDAASPVRSASPIVALAERPPVDEDRLYGGAAPILIAASVQDPGNLGAIVRVAHAAGAAGVVAADGAADPFGWKALRGSMGSVFHLPVAVRARLEDAVRTARSRGWRIAAAVPRGGTPYLEADLRERTAIVIGSEGSGLPDRLVESADLRLTIPMAPGVESLNAAVAAAILLYEARRQRTARSSPERGAGATRIIPTREQRFPIS